MFFDILYCSGFFGDCQDVSHFLSDFVDLNLLFVFRLTGLRVCLTVLPFQRIKSEVHGVFVLFYFCFIDFSSNFCYFFQSSGFGFICFCLSRFLRCTIKSSICAFLFFFKCRFLELQTSFLGLLLMCSKHFVDMCYHFHLVPEIILFLGFFCFLFIIQEYVVNLPQFTYLLELILLLILSFIVLWSNRTHGIISDFVFVEVCFVSQCIVNFRKKFIEFLVGICSRC